MDRTLQILMVEDNPGDVRLARIALQRSPRPGELHSVPDGEQALAYLRREGDYDAAARPHLILLDLNLPHASGFDVLRAIKNDPDLQSIPVCILSSSADEDDVRRSYALHANCYVTKPASFKGYSAVLLQLQSFWSEVVRLP